MNEEILMNKRGQRQNLWFMMAGSLFVGGMLGNINLGPIIGLDCTNFSIPLNMAIR